MYTRSKDGFGVPPPLPLLYSGSCIVSRDILPKLSQIKSDKIQLSPSTMLGWEEPDHKAINTQNIAEIRKSQILHILNQN